jgi:hypothetical protein
MRLSFLNPRQILRRERSQLEEKQKSLKKQNEERRPVQARMRQMTISVMTLRLTSWMMMSQCREKQERSIKGRPKHKHLKVRRRRSQAPHRKERKKIQIHLTRSSTNFFVKET